MTERTLYEKRGRRYVPVAQREMYDSHVWPSGAHLTVVEPGARMTRYSVNPDKAGLLAVLYARREACIAELSRMTEARPARGTPLTARQAAAWERWKQECGSLYAVEIPAISDAFDAIVKIVEAA